MTTAAQTSLQIRINDRLHTLPSPATLADALALAATAPPFAAAVNRVFVPRSAYRTHALVEGDGIEVIRPVTGG